MNVKTGAVLTKVVQRNDAQKIMRILILLLRLFRKKKIPSLAQSLAYTTILSLVPILAIFFSVLGVITESHTVKNNIRDFISLYFIPEYVSSIFDELEKLSSSSLALGAIGFPTLFLAGVFLYVKVDSSINEIWHSQKEKQWFKNSMAFFMTLFFGPMLLVLVFSIPPYLQTLPYYRQVINYALINALVTLMIPILISMVGLFVLYIYIPNVSVQNMAAFRGALVSSFLIQGSNLLVSWYLKNFSSYNLIYGSLAMIPIFLLWVFVLWLIVLVGATLTFIFQYYKGTGYLDLEERINDESLLSSALRVLVYISNKFKQRDGAPDFDQI
ncbi:MAG: YihY family inner membrane protein, partial [Deltaproteobacteria bacterium]|nr:YihY family inner membrane protein [Deltaproteobacteria bacterium]